MKTFSIIFIAVLVSCATPKALDNYAGWDSNGDTLIERSEFESAYSRNRYFDKWSPGISTSYEKFYSTVFATLDDNHNGHISLSEYNPYMKRFYFNMLSDSFDNWDVNGDRGIDKAEFNKVVADGRLAAMWDVSGDKSLTEHELAAGMFNFADTNNDNVVGEIEYNVWKVSR